MNFVKTRITRKIITFKVRVFNEYFQKDKENPCLKYKNMLMFKRKDKL